VADIASEYPAEIIGIRNLGVQGADEFRDRGRFPRTTARRPRRGKLTRVEFSGYPWSRVWRAG
jgi:hypothetical protein